MLIDQLIDTYKAPDEEFDITLERGETFRFKAVTSYEDLLALKRDALKFVKMAHSDKCPKDWLPYLPTDKEVLLNVFILSQTSVSPKLSHFELLKLANKVAFIFNHLVDNWESHQMTKQVINEAEQIDELKKS